MYKVVLLICFYHAIYLPSRAQNVDDSRIKKLKSGLVFLNGQARVDYLNRIAYRYVEGGPVRTDSGTLYASRAFALAEKINYKKALCIASNLYAKALLQSSKADEGLVYYRLTLRLAGEMKNDSLAALGIRGVGQALWYQGNYQKALDTITISINYFKRLGYIRQVSDATMIISNINGDQGNYEKAFEGAQESLRLSDSLHDVANTVLSHVQLGDLYKRIGDYPTALEYYRKGYSYTPDKGDWCYRHLCNSMGDMYCDLKQLDSAWYYYQQALIGFPASKTCRLRLGEYYLLRKSYDTALSYFTGLYSDLKGGGEGNILFYSLLGMGKVYLNAKDFAKAMQYGTQALELAQRKGSKLIIRDACQLLSAIHEGLNQPGHAFYYFKQYVQMKDSLITDQFKGKLYAFKRMTEEEKNLAQIELLKKKKLISEQKLEANRWLRNILSGGILFLVLLGIIVFRNITLKRKNEKLQNESIRLEWQRIATDLEMKALRAQMNPHFIFNCLSSINRFILKNESDKASDYLTRFSRLIRLVLINSQKSLIVLEDEVEMLRLYIEMEQLRFKNSFDYSITYTNNIEPANIVVPPLLFQPFCENAIWHGLMHKPGHGHMAIAFNMDNSILNCSITDDGIGRARAAEIKGKSGETQKSLGLKLTAERLALFNEDSTVQTSYDMEDVLDEKGNVSGTKVILKIRYKELVEETV